MTGIEMLRDVCKALKGSPWRGTDIATIGGEPACEKLSKIADQIERETLPRPRFEDGKVARIGEVARYLGKNKTIADMYVYSSGYHKVIFCDNTYLMLRPSEMLERPVAKVLDADGVEIKVGDEVWGVEDGSGPWTVEKIDGEHVTCVSDDSKWHRYARCRTFTHKRPEPPDTWEKIEADVVKGDACRYFGISDEAQQECRECEDCPARYSTANCGEAMAADVLRRCKALAGIEVR